MHRMLVDVLFDKVHLGYLIIRFEVTIDSELSYFVTTATFNAVFPDIHVVEDYLSLVAVLHVSSNPPLVCSSHFEHIRFILETFGFDDPVTIDSLVLKVPFIQDGMMFEVLFLKVSIAVLFNISLENEFSYVISTLAS